jgi:hypothetical protein
MPALPTPSESGHADVNGIKLWHPIPRWQSAAGNTSRAVVGPSGQAFPLRHLASAVSVSFWTVGAAGSHSHSIVPGGLEVTS